MCPIYSPVNYSNGQIHQFDGTYPEKIEIFHGELLLYRRVMSNDPYPIASMGLVYLQKMVDFYGFH